MALITGGGNGIGRAAALAFARQSVDVVIADVNKESSLETLHRVEQAGGSGSFVQTDVSSPGDVERLVEGIAEKHGRLDFAFNNAGVSSVGGVIECTDEEWNATISTNLTGVWLCMKHEISQMLKQGAGCIVNNASVYGLVAAGEATAYIASKHGVVGLTKSAALQYAAQGIRINAVCPAFTRTAMIQHLLDDPDAEERLARSHPMGRLAAPEEVAGAVLWLCSDAATFVTGHTLPVDGGYLAR